MLLLVAVVGIVTVLLGLIVATDRIDNYWGNRRTEVRRRPSQLPPLFRTSHNQCVKCGNDNDLLNLDEVCRYCFDLEVLHG